MSKKNMLGKGANKSKLKLSAGDLSDMAMADALRPERMNAFFTVDSIVDSMIYETANIMKEREIAVKITPFAVIHTRKTMERLFDTKFFCYDQRKDDGFCSSWEDSAEPEAAPHDMTVWDMLHNDADVQARRAFQQNNVNNKLKSSFKAGLAGMFTKGGSKSSSSKASLHGKEETAALSAFQQKFRKVKSPRSQFLSQDKPETLKKKMYDIPQQNFQPRDDQVDSALDIDEFVRLNRESLKRIQARKEEDARIERNRLNKRMANQQAATGETSGGASHFAEAVQNARRQGGAENMPYFVEDGMQIPISKVNGDKLPKDLKTPINPVIHDVPSEIVADQTAVKRMEREMQREIERNRAPTNKTVAGRQGVMFNQANEDFANLEKVKRKPSYKGSLSKDTSGMSRGSLHPSEQTEIVTNHAKMFVYPGKINSSTINLMLSYQDSEVNINSPPATGNRSNGSKGSGRSKKEKVQTLEQMLNSDDIKIPGIRPLKNLDMLKNIKADKGVALAVERKENDKSEAANGGSRDGERSVGFGLNSQNAQRTSVISGASARKTSPDQNKISVDNLDGENSKANDSILESALGTERLRPQPFKKSKGTNESSMMDVQKQTRFKQLQQGEPYTLLASDEKTQRMSKFGYQCLKEEQESLREQYEQNKQNELLFGSQAGEDMSQITSGNNSREGKPRHNGQNSTKSTSFNFASRTKSVQPIRVQHNQSPKMFTKKRSYDIVVSPSERNNTNILIDQGQRRMSLGFGKQDSSKNYITNVDYSPLPSIMKKGSHFGNRNNSQAMTFSNFEKMPQIDTRELNNNSGLRQHENRSIQVSPGKRTLPFGHNTVQEGSFTPRPAFMHANATQQSFFNATKHSKDTYGEKQDPKDVIQRMRLRINTAISKLDADEGKADHKKNLKGYSRNPNANFDSMTNSNALTAMLRKTNVPPSARNLNSIRSMHRQNKSPRAGTITKS